MIGRSRRQSAGKWSPGRDVKLWPGHPKPFSDESFASWVSRLAAANGLPTRAFLSAAGLTPSEVVDLDQIGSDAFYEVLSSGTALHPEVLRSLTIANYIRLFTGGDFARAPYQLLWIRSGPGIARLSSQFCFECVLGAPYLRREWRLSFVVACSTHGTLLREFCLACVARSGFPNQASEPTGVHDCAQCLGKGVISEPVGPDILWVQRVLLESLTINSSDDSKSLTLRTSIFRGMYRVVEEHCRVMLSNQGLATRSATYLSGEFNRFGPSLRYRILMPIVVEAAVDLERFLSVCGKIGALQQYHWNALSDHVASYFQRSSQHTEDKRGHGVTRYGDLLDEFSRILSLSIFDGPLLLAASLQATARSLPS